MKWFETLGDASQASVVLGNSTKMTMDCYMPKPIQFLMNVRMIKRFQNLIICAATAGKEYMLEATDFSTLGELQEFLADMLLVESDDAKDTEDTLTIKDILKSKLNMGPKATPEVEAALASDSASKKLRVSISVNSLAALFLYEEHIVRANIKDLGDIEDKTNPRFWTGLAKTLHRLLPNHPANREFSSIYSQSLQRVDELRDKVTFPDIAEKT